MGGRVNGLFPGVLTPDATVGGCIDIFENAWPNPEETIRAMEEQALILDSGIKWERASTIGQGKNQDRRTNYTFGLTEAAETHDNAVAQNIHNQYYVSLLAATIPYADRYGYDSMLYHEGYNVLKYSGGQQYHAHYDGDTITGRSISAILYLNSDFEGGEVEFVNFNIKIKPQPGMLLVFPSNYAYTHIAHPVTSGTKYAIVTWIKDRDLNAK
jgi:hypothetical protein